MPNILLFNFVQFAAEKKSLTPSPKAQSISTTTIGKLTNALHLEHYNKHMIIQVVSRLNWLLKSWRRLLMTGDSLAAILCHHIF